MAWRPLLLVSLAVAMLLIAVSGRYGYHRDELYFIEAGRHLAWGYPDQPPLTPLLARVVSTVADGSLVALRVPSAVASGLVVLFTGLMARELRGGRSAQLVFAACMAVSCVLLVGPALVPVWVAGLVRLVRDPAVRYARSLGWAYGLLVLFLVTGGKPPTTSGASTPSCWRPALCASSGGFPGGPGGTAPLRSPSGSVPRSRYR